MQRLYDESRLDGYRASPLLIGRQRETAAGRALCDRQEQLLGYLESLAAQEIGQYVRPAVTELAILALVQRFGERQGLNANSFDYRLYADPQPELVPELSPEYVRAATQRSLYGNGSAADNDITRRAYAMETVEYANLTSVCGLRDNLRPYMYAAVSNLLGRETKPMAAETYGLKVYAYRDLNDTLQWQTQPNLRLLRLDMKQRLGHLQDGTEVKLRTQAIINTTPSSGFDQTIADDIRRAASENKDPAEVMTVQRMVNWLIDTKPAPGIVLHKNETIYGVSSPSE